MGYHKVIAAAVISSAFAVTGALLIVPLFLL